jgi:hypothetical protein
MNMKIDMDLDICRHDHGDGHEEAIEVKGNQVCWFCLICRNQTSPCVLAPKVLNKNTIVLMKQRGHIIIIYIYI